MQGIVNSVITGIITTGALLVLLTGCASNEEIERELTTYIGDYVNEAISRLGRPDRIYDMQNDTKEYHWVTNSANATINTNVMGIPMPQSKPRKCKRVLLVDERKKVIGHLVEGNC
ncbi:MAG TPA: hypothetical protein DCM54_10985 [Gammaproteobacteria bacterium]|nr:hypothetical protein [Gammaproteobacteria bacterium]